MPTHVTEAGDKAERLAALHKRKIQARYNKLQTARKTASALGGGGGSSSRGRRKGTSDTTLGNDSHGYSFLVVQAVIRIQRNCRMRLARMERRRRIRDRVMGRAVASHRPRHAPPKAHRSGPNGSPDRSDERRADSVDGVRCARLPKP